MPFTEPTSDVIAVLTNAGRAELSRSILGEVSLHVSAWQIGRGGYLDTNPVKVDSINPASTTLIDPIPNVANRRSFLAIEQPVGPNVVAPICRLNPGDTDAEFGLGELGIFATYDRDIITPANVGTDFLFAVAHFPLVSKTPSHTLIWRVIIAF
jgi:hypothetical protein